MPGGADGVRRWQGGVRVALVGAQRAPHRGRCQTRSQAGGTALGIRLAVALANGVASRQEVGVRLFRPCPPTACHSIKPEQTPGACVPTLTHGPPPPP